MLANWQITPGIGSELDAGLQLLELSDGDIHDLKQMAAERGIVVVTKR